MTLEHSSPDEPTATLLERLDERGFLIFPSLVGAETLDAIREELGPYLQGEYPGRNDFEGLEGTERGRASRASALARYWRGLSGRELFALGLPRDSARARGDPPSRALRRRLPALGATAADVQHEHLLGARRL